MPDPLRDTLADAIRGGVPAQVNEWYVADLLLPAVRAYVADLERKVAAVEALITGWRGGTGHTDNNKWVSIADLRAALAGDPAPGDEAG